MKMLEKINHYALEHGCGCAIDSDVPGSSSIPKGWESRYDEITPALSNIFREDVTGAYTPQGATTDGTYLYRALVSEDSEPTWVQKIELSTGKVVKESKSTSYGHANDLCYAKGFLYIAHSSSTNILYKVNPDTLALVETINLPVTIWGIDYCAEYDLFILGSVGSAYFSVYYSDFKFMYRIKPDNPYYGLVRQGIHCDSNYIYVSLDNAYGTVTGNDVGSRIMVYTWNGIFVKSIYIPIKEIEWGFPVGADMYIGTYEGRDPNDIKSGIIYKVPYDLYPGQTVLTGRPTEVSGGINNLQRLPEGTPVRLWEGSISAPATTITLDSAATGLIVDEDGPFRYLRFRFKGANQQVFDWYPTNTGVPCLREVDITDAQEDSTIRVREMRMSFSAANQTFSITSNTAEEIFKDASENTITINKYREITTKFDPIVVTQIWGIV